MNTLTTLLPDFAVIATGALIGPYLTNCSWKQIDALSYYLLYPALLFTAASQRVIEPGALLHVGLLAGLVVTTGLLLTLLVQPLNCRHNLQNRAGISQNAYRFNTALGFVAIAALPTEASGVLAITVGIGIPLANLYAVLTLTRGQTKSRLHLCREIAGNPFLLASLAGVSVGLIGTPLPVIAADFTDRLSAAAIPIVLLSLGAALRQAKLWPPDIFSVAITGIRLLILPALVWTTLTVTGSRGLEPATLLIFAALPTASSAHVLAARYGANRSEVATSVMQSTAIGLVTLPFWVSLAVSICGD